MPCTPTTHDDRQTRRRRRGSLPRSCAECRRLKLRCDRQVPCQSCVKRGCGAICPDGCLTTGQGNRFVLASTEELHEKIQKLAYRIRSLEDGLRDSHAKFASDTHPLLEPALLDIKAPLQRDVTPKSSRSSPGAPDHTAAHLFPTLSTLSPRGSAFSSASSQDDDDDLSCASSEGASVPVRRPRTRPLTPAQAPPVIPATYTDMHAWDGSYHDASHFAHSGTVGVDALPSIEFFSPPHNTFDVAPMQHYMPQQQPFTTSKTIDPFATNWDAEFTTPAGEMSWNDLISSIYN